LTPNSDAEDTGKEDIIKSLYLEDDEVEENDFASLFDLISCIQEYDDLPDAPHDNIPFEASILSILESFMGEFAVKYICHSNTPSCVQVDGGTDRSITPPHCELMHRFRTPDPLKGDNTHINDAGAHAHKILGYGYFRVSCLDSRSQSIFIDVPCAYIPLIPSMFLNFWTTENLLDVTETLNMLLGVGTADLSLSDDADNTYNLTVPLMVYKMYLYADNMLV
jgi:hypothetical protein